MRIQLDIIPDQLCNFCQNTPPDNHIVITWTTSKGGFYSAYCNRLCLKNAMNKDVAQ